MTQPQVWGIMGPRSPTRTRWQLTSTGPEIPGSFSLSSKRHRNDVPIIWLAVTLSRLLPKHIACDPPRPDKFRCWTQETRNVAWERLILGYSWPFFNNSWTKLHLACNFRTIALLLCCSYCSNKSSMHIPCCVCFGYPLLCPRISRFAFFRLPRETRGKVKQTFGDVPYLILRQTHARVARKGKKKTFSESRI